MQFRHSPLSELFAISKLSKWKIECNGDKTAK